MTIEDKEYKKLIQICFPAYEFKELISESSRGPKPDLVSKDNKILVECGNLSEHIRFNQYLDEDERFKGAARFDALFRCYPDAEEIWWFPHPEKNTLGGLLWFRYKKATLQEEKQAYKRLKDSVSKLEFEYGELIQKREKLLNNIEYRVNEEVRKTMDDIRRIKHNEEEQ